MRRLEDVKRSVRSRGRAWIASARIVTSQHIDHGPDQLRNGALVVIGFGFVQRLHDAVFVVERHLSA